MSAAPPRTRAVLAAATLGLGAGLWLVHDGSRSQAPPTPSAADAFTYQDAGPPTDWSAVPTAETPPSAPPMPPSPPIRIRIPKIGVDALVTPVDLNAAGQLPAPPNGNTNLVGWYARSTTPGSTGNAVIDGHVDTKAGPAVFWALGALHRLDTVDITRADRATAEFTIDAIEVYEKAGFPSERVYGDTERPELRLLTCGGGYRKGTGYLGNVVVFAHLTKNIQAPPR